MCLLWYTRRKKTACFGTRQKIQAIIEICICRRGTASGIALQHRLHNTAPCPLFRTGSSHEDVYVFRQHILQKKVTLFSRHSLFITPFCSAHLLHQSLHIFLPTMCPVLSCPYRPRISAHTCCLSVASFNPTAASYSVDKITTAVLAFNYLPTFTTVTVYSHQIVVSTLRTGSFKLFKRPFPGFLTILTL